jgi:hypothetical protein
MNTGKSHVRRDPVRFVARAVVALGSIALVYACADASNSSTGPAARGAEFSPGASSQALGPNDPVTPGVVTLCKVGADGAFNVQVGVNGTPTAHTVVRNTCETIASVPPTQRDDVIVTVTENTAPSYALDHISLRQGTNAAKLITGQRSVSFEAVHGAIITYYNNAVVTVCKEGTAGTFQYQIGLGQPMQNLSLASGQCQAIGSIPHAQPDDVIVTVRENASTTYRLDHMELKQGMSPTRTITGETGVSFEGVHGAVLTFHNVAVTEGKEKKCDADKSLKDPKVHDENHDCRSEQGEQSDKKYTGK